MKINLKYAISLIIATAILGLVAVFVPPVWAACKCTYNEIKTFLIFPGSFLGGLIVLLLTHISFKKGRDYRKAFYINLLILILIFCILGFYTGSVADYINDNNIPIFQPDYSSKNVDALDK